MKRAIVLSSILASGFFACGGEKGSSTETPSGQGGEGGDGDGAPPASVPPTAILYDVALGQDDPRFETFPSSLSLVEANLPLTIRAEAEGAGAVLFEFSGVEVVDVEAPFLMHEGGAKADSGFEVGTHSVKITALDNATDRNVLGVTDVSLEITTAGTDETPEAGEHEILKFWKTGSGKYVTQDAEGNFIDAAGDIVIAAADVNLRLSDDDRGWYDATDSATDTIAFAFQLLLPDGYDPKVKYPVVTLLHHGWQIFRGTDNDGDIEAQAPLTSGTRSLTKSAFRHQFPAVVFLPQDVDSDPIDAVSQEWAAFSALSNATGSFVSGPEFSVSAAHAMSVLQALEDGSLQIKGAPLGMDVHRLYLTGHSRGGLGTWDVIQRQPDYFAAAVPMTGYQDHEKAGLLTEIPIWAFHHQDDPSNPYVGTQTMVGLIEAAGGTKVKLTTYSADNYTRSHPHNDLNAQAWNDEPGLYEWIFGQVNNRR